MKRFETDKITDLADVFCAVIGGRPESIKEIEEFVEQSPLKKLLPAAEIRRIIEFDGFFAEETAMAVYALLPIKIPLNKKQSWIMPPKSFLKLNEAKMSAPHSRLINIPFPKANAVLQNEYDEKIKKVIEFLFDLNKKKDEKAKAARYKKELEKEKNKLRARKRRAEHPGERKNYYKKLETLSEEEQERRRAENRRRNAVYRAKHRDELRQKAVSRRADMKENNPELLKELDKKNNERADRKAIGHRYYLKHKEEILQKTGQNPMSKVYKQRYEIKRRLKKTGPVILSLLAGIAAAKSQRGRRKSR